MSWGEPTYLAGGEVIVAHRMIDCLAPCPIHAPSDHHMLSWPQHWRGDRRIIERICEHGVGHTDPDEQGFGGHGCDGCCVPPKNVAVDRLWVVARRAGIL